ncbi:hypothetical protein C6341_g3492 [Phytophthora cactorum]|nr:hypothetical protein C6341_g3492 [Phytophthora cactorum]
MQNKKFEVVTAVNTITSCKLSDSSLNFWVRFSVVERSPKHQCNGHRGKGNGYLELASGSTARWPQDARRSTAIVFRRTSTEPESLLAHCKRLADDSRPQAAPATCSGRRAALCRLREVVQ